MRFRTILLLLFILMLIPLVSSLDNIVQQNDVVDIRVTPTFNGTINSVNCNITINDPDGQILVSFKEMQKNIDSQDFNYTLPNTNTSKIGFYDCVVYAFSNKTDNRIFSCSFEVNPSGKEYIPEISGPLLFGAILTMLFISGFLFVLGNRIELFPMKVFLIILSGVITILNIGFVTASFQEFYSTNSPLSSSFGSLYIAFGLILTSASIFLLIWIVITGFKLWKIKRGFFVEDEVL